MGVRRIEERGGVAGHKGIEARRKDSGRRGQEERERERERGRSRGMKPGARVKEAGIRERGREAVEKERREREDKRREDVYLDHSGGLG